MSTQRTTAVGTQSSSDTLSAAEYNDAAGGGIGRSANITSDQGSITSVTDLTGMTTGACTVNTSRLIKVTAECRMSNSSSTGGFILEIWEGSTRLQSRAGQISVADLHGAVTCTVILTPSAGSHTYKARADRSNGGTVTMHADAEFPAFIIAEDIGPSF